MGNDDINLARPGTEQPRLVPVRLEVPRWRPRALGVQRALKVLHAPLYGRERPPVPDGSEYQGAPQKRTPIDRDALGDQVVQARALFGRLPPLPIHRLSGCAGVVLATARDVDDRRDRQLAHDENARVVAPADVPRQDQDIAVPYRAEDRGVRQLVRPGLQVQVGGDLDLHGRLRVPVPVERSVRLSALERRLPGTGPVVGV